MGWNGKVNGIIADLGVSSYQLDTLDTGFSFKSRDSLDMRFNRTGNGFTAKEVVNEWSEKELARILKEYGEEKFHRRLAHKIVKHREYHPIETGEQLAELIKHTIPRNAWPKKIHPATRAFQGIRIAVNDELNALEIFLKNAISVLAPGGRLAVISFHSLEDRIVKKAFLEQAKACVCPPDFPICQCDKEAIIKILN